MPEVTQELMLLLNQIEREKGIDKALLVEGITSAVVSASRKFYGAEANIEAVLDNESGRVDLFCHKTVVKKVSEPEMEISLKEAATHKADAKVGDLVAIPLPFESFGRIAAQTAKQVILQRVREAEREMVYNEYKDRKEELVNGIVTRVEKGTIYVDIGKGEGVLPRREQVFRETYRRSDRIRALILEVRQASRGPQVILSRTHPALVVKLFAIEVPEIYEGIVEIKEAVREPSGRSKIAVVSHDKDVDPVGACVGMRGSRVQSIVQELRGEKIDIIQWTDDLSTFAANALSPAKISRVILGESEQAMVVVVPDDQLSLAIGRSGQNVRLAAKLLKWKIDLKGESEYQREQAELAADVLSGGRKGIPLIELGGLGPKTAEHLKAYKIRTVENLAAVSLEDLTAIPGIGSKRAEVLLNGAKEHLAARVAAAEKDEEAPQESAQETEADLPETKDEELEVHETDSTRSVGDNGEEPEGEKEPSEKLDESG